MEQNYLPTAEASFIRTQRGPRTDGWAWMWTSLMAISLAWSLVWLGGASVDPCSVEGECWGVLIGVIMWFYGQLFAAIPVLAGLGVLARYVVRGNRGVPALGLALLAANVAISAAFLAYLSRY